MGGNSRGGAKAGLTGGKRPRPDNNDADSQSAGKKLLANNRFAVLDGAGEMETPQPIPNKKEKVPPFFVKGFPTGLRERIYFFIDRGLKCTIKMCSEGYKLMVPAMNHYKAVQTMLDQMKVEYFSHDIEASKPLKVVLRGLPDMEIEALSEELQANGLKPVQIHKMARHDATRKFRDQLYLVHLEKHSTCLKDLQNFRALFHIVVNWERYKPIHRGVTQCSNCLLFGHGTKNCRMAPRCNKCGEQHKPDACKRMEEAEPKCANCGAEHQATSKTCPKRAEFIAIRKKASTNNQPGRRKVPDNNGQHFPPIVPRPPIPVLPPLPLNDRLAAAAAAAALTAGVPKPPANSNQQTTAAPGQDPSPAPGLNWPRDEAPLPLPKDNTNTLYSPEQLIPLFTQLSNALRSCQTRFDQIQTLGLFVIQYGL